MSSILGHFWNERGTINNPARTIGVNKDYSRHTKIWVHLIQYKWYPNIWKSYLEMVLVPFGTKNHAIQKGGKRDTYVLILWIIMGSTLNKLFRLKCFCDPVHQTHTEHVCCGERCGCCPGGCKDEQYTLTFSRSPQSTPWVSRLRHSYGPAASKWLEMVIRELRAKCWGSSEEGRAREALEFWRCLN